MENLFPCFYRNTISLQKIKIDTIVDLKIENAKNNCLKSGLSIETANNIHFANSLDEVHR